MRLIANCMLYAALVLTFPADGQQAATTWVDVTAMQHSTDAETIAVALTRHGYSVKRTEDANDHKTHIQLGPYTAARAEAVRAKIAAEGFTASVTVAPVPAVATAPGGLTPEQQRLEAEAMAKFGGAPSAAVPSSSADLEAQALAKLGLAPERKGPQTPAEREADALRAMQANTAQAEIDSENRRQAQLIAEQQAEADRLQREIAQSEAQRQTNSAPQQSTAASFLNGLSAVIAGATASMAQNQANNDSINQALQQQQAKLRGLQQQIAVNQAAEQARQQAAALSRQQRAIQQQAPVIAPSLQNTAGARIVGSANPVPSRSTTSTSTNTVAPQPALVTPDVTKPPISGADWQRQQAAIDAAPVSIQPPTHEPTGYPSFSQNANFIETPTPYTHICPRVGYVLIGHYAAKDVYEGQKMACTPGRQLTIVWPAPTGSNSVASNGTHSGTAGTGSGRGTGNGSSGNSGSEGGSASNDSHYQPALSSTCISMDFNGDYHWDQYYNNCGVTLHLDVIFPRALGRWGLDFKNGKPQGTAHSRQEYANYGQPSLYVCPAGYHVADASGHIPNVPIAQFRCREDGW